MTKAIKTINATCRECGGTNVHREGACRLKWDAETKGWTPFDAMPTGWWCDDCCDEVQVENENAETGQDMAKVEAWGVAFTRDGRADPETWAFDLLHQYVLAKAVLAKRRIPFTSQHAEGDEALHLLMIEAGDTISDAEELERCLIEREDE